MVQYHPFEVAVTNEGTLGPVGSLLQDTILTEQCLRSGNFQEDEQAPSKDALRPLMLQMKIRFQSLHSGNKNRKIYTTQCSGSGGI